MQWEGVEAGFKHWPTFCGKCSWKEHSPWHLVKEASKVTLLMPLVKNQIKHYQGSGGGGGGGGGGQGGNGGFDLK